MLEWSTLVNSDYYSSGTIAQSLPEFIAVLDEYEYNANKIWMIWSANYYQQIQSMKLRK